mmetsp:Transcript_2461/g.8247  ORF Transcript_2461/g.8247 Transcript_2461/m.8247 type:complete len:297 (+) Transcript_2461:108-998(+)
MLFGGRRNEVFDEQYHCFSGAFADKPNLEEGDKVLLPSSAFEQLARLQIEYPMLFELRSAKGRTHCGVLEFTAPEGNCYVPFWMMQNLMLEEGGVLSVKNVSLPKATFVKFKPQSTDFLDISNPRAVLEKQFRTFSCLTVGDQICLPYNDKRFYLEVQEVKPREAACIIECDCEVDFDAPVGYTEPDYASRSRATSEASSMPDLPAPLKALSAAKEAEAKAKAEGNFKSFAGAGSRLDGKDLKSAQAALLEKMPQQPPASESSKAWQSRGMSCAGDAAAKRAAGAAGRDRFAAAAP